MPAALFNSNYVKILKDALKFKSGTVINTNDTDNPTSVAKSGKIGDLYQQSGTSDWYVKTDNGTTTNWVKLANEDKISNISLALNTTSFTNISELTFPLASTRALQIDYSIKEDSSLKMRVGRLSVATDGTIISVFDQIDVQTEQIGQGAEGLELDAIISGSDIVVRFKNTDVTNASVMECYINNFN